MTRPAARFLTFNGVGALGIVVQLATVHGFVTWGHAHPVVATAAGVGAAVVHNFLWHRHWTWRDRPGGPALVVLGQFVLANGVISLAGNIAIVALLGATTHVGTVAANVAAIVACGIVNYAVSDRVVFAGRS